MTTTTYELSQTPISEIFEKYFSLIEDVRNFVTKKSLKAFDCEITNIIQDSSKEVKNTISENSNTFSEIKVQVFNIGELPPNMSAELTRLIKLLNITDEKFKKDTQLKAQVAGIITNLTDSLLNQIIDVKIPINTNIVEKWKELNNKVEIIWRYLELSAPEDEDGFTATVKWFSQQRDVEILDLLREVESQPPYRSKETMFLLEQAQIGIYKRECKELMAFYKLEPGELNSIINATIEFGKHLEHPAMREIFGTEKPSEVLDALKRIKILLEKYKTPETIKEWFESPIKDFRNFTPREALFKGRVFPVLDFLHILEERVYH